MSDQDDDLGSFSMLELFKIEVESQAKSLTDNLSVLVDDTENVELLTNLMRAVHSIKGAARMVNVEPAVKIAHVMKDVFAAAQEAKIVLQKPHMDTLSKGVDLLKEVSIQSAEEMPAWISQEQENIDALTNEIKLILAENSNPQQNIEKSSQPPNPPPPPTPTATVNPGPCPTLELGEPAMLELFTIEVETHANVLQENILELEQEPTEATRLEALMRAAHSIKGAARMVNVEPAVKIAHVMEDVFVAAQEGKLILQSAHADILLQGVDTLLLLSKIDFNTINQWLPNHWAEIIQLEHNITTILNGEVTPQVEKSVSATSSPASNMLTGELNFDADPAMLELFTIEVHSQSKILLENLLELEQSPDSEQRLEALMRATHSIKNAAAMVSVEPAIQIAHALEEVFIAAQKHKIVLQPTHKDIFLKSVDLLSRIATVEQSKAKQWFQQTNEEINTAIQSIRNILSNPTTRYDNGTEIEPATDDKQNTTEPANIKQVTLATTKKAQDTAVRVSANSLNRLMGLAGESLVESRWIRPFADTMLNLKKHHVELISSVDFLREICMKQNINEEILNILKEVEIRTSHCREELAERIGDLEDYDRRATNLSSRLNREVISSRMRPFADGVHGFRRMIRDVARSLNKEVILDIKGLKTQVDRDILEKIEAPLNHILRNAVDHGIEMPDDREANGKQRQAKIKLEATHVSGMLSIIVEDDGIGIDVEHIRKKVIERKLTNEQMATNMTDTELFEFLFLPSFSTKEQVSEISGRGVGLDVVHSVMQEMRGTVRTTSTVGKGTKFHMQLPLTLSVVRALMVEISGEPYAFPLARVNRTLKLQKSSVELLEGRQYFTLGNQHIGILSAFQVIGLSHAPPEDEILSVVVIGEKLNQYALVVDKFLGERELVVHALDARLGKVKDIASASIMDDGTPTLIIDTEDMIRSIDILISGGRLDRLGKSNSDEFAYRKRVLVVDDSITVREVERNMLEAKGYSVEVAVDGMDGWNAIRTNSYDLVISDIDMPRMNGFEFVSLIKKDSKLKSIPVMIVSYKDREEDRIRGLDVGADYYLTKGSFQDDTLLDAVADLIGKP